LSGFFNISPIACEGQGGDDGCREEPGGSPGGAREEEGEGEEEGEEIPRTGTLLV